MMTNALMSQLATHLLPASRWRRVLAGTLFAWTFGASAQPADPFAPFTGTWSGVFTTQDHEYGRLPISRASSAARSISTTR